MSVIIPQMDDPSWRTSGIINRINPPSIPTGRRHSLPPLKHFPKPKKFLRKFQPIQHPTSALQRCQIRPQSAAIIISFSYICLGFVSIISPLSFSFLFSFFLIFFSLHFDDFYDPKRQVKKTLVENGAYLIYSAWLPPSAACHSNNNIHTHTHTKMESNQENGGGGGGGGGGICLFLFLFLSLSPVLTTLGNHLSPGGHLSFERICRQSHLPG